MARQRADTAPVNPEDKLDFKKILPIFVITNFPPLFVLRKMPPIYLAWALVIPIALLGVVRLAWKKGLSGYSSASS